MKPLSLLPLTAILALLPACTQQITTRYDYYPPCTLTCTVGHHGTLTNRLVHLPAMTEVTHYAETRPRWAGDLHR